MIQGLGDVRIFTFHLNPVRDLRIQVSGVVGRVRFQVFGMVANVGA